VTLTAIDRDDVTSTASVTITLLPPAPIFLAAHGVSVTRAAPPPVVDRNVGAMVSVGLMPSGAPALHVAAPVSVARDVTASAFVTPPAVSVITAPVITAIVPASAARGAIDVFVTITGSGLTGATDLAFLRSNVDDADITVRNIVVDLDGTRLTALVTVGGSATLGGHVVQVIVTPTVTSTPLGTGVNVFTVQ
jgi:hypothetical protein